MSFCTGGPPDGPGHAQKPNLPWSVRRSARVRTRRGLRADGSQVHDLQRDALIGAGVDPGHIYEDSASGRRDDRPGRTLPRYSSDGARRTASASPCNSATFVAQAVRSSRENSHPPPCYGCSPGRSVVSPRPSPNTLIGKPLCVSIALTLRHGSDCGRLTAAIAVRHWQSGLRSRPRPTVASRLSVPWSSDCGYHASSCRRL
jgi:hypothetical protein